MSLATANQYAKALLEVMAHPGATTKAETVLEQLAYFDSVLHESQELKTALLSPAVGLDKKEKIIIRLAGDSGMARETVRFLSVVVSRRRLSLLPEIRAAIQGQLDEQRGIRRAAVASASELPIEQRQQLETKLAAVAGRQVTCEYAVDPSLIGGLSVKMGSKFYDGSILGQVDALKRKLSAGA